MDSRASEKEYSLRFFRENGFKRQKCKVGGEYFWSLGDHETCQDAPCTEYWFDEVPSIGRLSVDEARRLFLGFFERNGHAVLKPRPVVARWRDDLYLTIASIVVFQPHVTSGLVPPPANPLTISQPSIRLEDIDNVGLTIGRHLTSFEMAAHHAFNYPDKRVYWKEETVEYAYRFFTEEMKIPGELITFKESWWEGGGNAGPSFEVAVGGLELATLVFMKYRKNGQQYEEIPLKIVDTGYGVERLSWFTAKTPTAFHAIYGDLLHKFRGKLGIEEPEESILWSAFKAAGRLDPEDPASVERYFSDIASRTGLDVDIVKEVLNREKILYSILDHTRTIALMLGDGVVPSNTGEGYLARLVIRRALRQLWKANTDLSLVDLVEMQINYWKNSFPQIWESRDYILDATAYEEERYRETLKKGYTIIAKTLRKKGKITLDDLVKLYESHGIPPDYVAEEAAKRGVRVEVPLNFYNIVASRHQAQTTLGKRSEDKSRLPEDILEWASGLPETRRLFHENPYQRRFEAKVISAKENYLVLDQTAFYPEGGGQDYDTGVIRSGETEYRVISVHKTPNNVIVHVLDSSYKGELDVHGEIDWHRRYRLMRHHTATHIVLGAARRVLGSHVWQAGAEKTTEKARLDITHHKPLSKKEVREIEKLANMVVDDRRRVKAVIMERNKAEEKYGFKLYQGGVPKTPYIRVVDIEGWDTQACFGTHLENTGEVGGVKLVNVERLADGVVRLEFTAGTRVAEKAGEYEEILESIGSLVKAGKEDAPKRIRKILEENRTLQSVITTYRKYYIESILKSAEPVDGLYIAVFKAVENDRRSIQEILREITGRNENLVAIAYTDDEDGSLQVFIALGRKAAGKISARDLAKKLSVDLNGKGGGGQTFASIRLQERLSGEDLKRAVLGYVKNAI
ncbi:MAG: alanine--tRNA ligase [Desulfurococcales archaeon]|nr:alanine--tRNA ligase [Desulfurococcales archaeon]